MLPMPLQTGIATEIPTSMVLSIVATLMGVIAVLARFSYSKVEASLRSDNDVAKSEAARAHARIAEQDEAIHRLDLEVAKLLAAAEARQELRDRMLTRDGFEAQMGLLNDVNHRQLELLEAIGKRTGSVAEMPAVRPHDRQPLPPPLPRCDSSDPPPAAPPRRRLPSVGRGGE